MDKRRKTYTAGLDLKSDDKGAFVARFAELGPPPDHDNDITLPGAFENGAKVPVGAWNHEGPSLPVGSGVIYADDKEARISGKFYLNSTAGREHYETLKAMAADLGKVEWSYVFSIIESEPGDWNGQRVRYLKKLDVWSVDPVLRGAGRTGLLSIKGATHRMDPKDALLDIEILETTMRLQELGPAKARASTPQDVQRAMLDLMDAGQIQEVINDELFELEVARLEAKLDEPTIQTNRDILRKRIEEAFGDGVSEAYIEAQLGLHLQQMVEARYAEAPYAGPESAWAAVLRWAREPSVQTH